MKSVRNGTISIYLKSIFVIVSILVFIPETGAAADSFDRGRTIRIEEVELLQPEQWRFSIGARHEAGRIAAEVGEKSVEYNNTRINPLSLRVGLLNNLEVGALIGYSFNSASSSFNYPDESGMESLTLQSRIQWHRFFGTSIRLKFSPEDTIMPYGGDQVGLQLNFPIQFPLADGMFHAEFGYTFQGGDFKDGAGNKICEWDDYFNMGLGYKWSAGRVMTYAVELVGHSSTLDYEAQNVESKDNLELLLGSTVNLSPQSRLIPSVGFGLLEGSPDLSVGFRYEVDFGQWRQAPTAEEELPERYSRRRPVGGAEDEHDAIFDRDSELDNSKGRQKESLSRRIENLKQQAKKAYRAGNYDEAIDNFRRILLLEPDNALVHANLGSLYYRQRNYSRARDHYKRAVQLDPTDVDSHKYLGASYYQLGEWEQAARHFRRVLELDPGNQQVRQWLRQIQ